MEAQKYSPISSGHLTWIFLAGKHVQRVRWRVKRLASTASHKSSSYEGLKSSGTYSVELTWQVPQDRPSQTTEMWAGKIVSPEFDTPLIENCPVRKLARLSSIERKYVLPDLRPWRKTICTSTSQQKNQSTGRSRNAAPFFWSPWKTSRGL